MWRELKPRWPTALSSVASVSCALAFFWVHYPEMSNVKLRLLCVIWPDNNPTPTRPINWSWNWPRLGLLNSLRDAVKFEYHHHILHEFDASQLVLRSQFEILEERLKKWTIRPRRTRRIWASSLTSHLHYFENVCTWSNSQHTYSVTPVGVTPMPSLPLLKVFM